MLCGQLELVRAYVGNKPINVRSGYRTPYYNKLTGGSPRSQHKVALAADVDIDGMTPGAVFDAVQEMHTKGLLIPGGLGKYRHFTHIDFRGYQARWDMTSDD